MSRQEKEDVLCNLCGQHITWWFPIETEDGDLYHRDCYNHMKRLMEELVWFDDLSSNNKRKSITIPREIEETLGEKSYEIIKTKRKNVDVEPIEDAGGQSTVEGAVQKDCASKGEE